MSKAVIIVLVVVLIGILTYVTANFVATEFFAYDEDYIHANAVYWIAFVGFLGGGISRSIVGRMVRAMSEDY